MEYFATVADKRFIIDWDKLPDASKERVIRYGVQRIINDKCGGANKTVDEKHGIAAKMVEALVLGTVPARGNGGVDPVLVETRRLALKAWVAKEPKQRSPLVQVMSAKDKDIHADNILAKVSDEIRAKLEAMGEAEVARKRAEAEAKRKTADKVAEAMGDIEL